MLEIKSIYLNRNKKQILSNFNLILKKKMILLWREWSRKIKSIGYSSWSN